MTQIPTPVVRPCSGGALLQGRPTGARISRRSKVPPCGVRICDEQAAAAPGPAASIDDLVASVLLVDADLVKPVNLGG